MLYNTARAILRYIFLILGLKIEGFSNIPPSGAIIVAPNHLSYLDPLLVAVAINRPVNFMAKAELFHNKILGKLLTMVYAFPVKRGNGDRHAIRHALQLMEEGKVLGIFPEGTRKKPGQVEHTQGGAAMIALRSGAPVLPIACIGSDKTIPCGWLWPLIIRIGEPISMLDYQDQKINSETMEKLSNEITDKINALLSK
ncbi:MAG: 1-acyl-sn-glycerol-3-phosphate acyltransferase [Firmicutes bacterium]|nr:1-acyl-sn-glycerol-3-phosphate acyltransferase [Bacillota bacterium]